MLESDYLGYQYEFHSPKRIEFDKAKPIFTVILDVYYHLALVKESIGSVLNQTYENVELMLIDNGAKDDVSAYVRELYENGKNISFIKFNKNVFSWDDPCLNVSVCWNAGLRHCLGAYVSHLGYDDKFSLNYCEKMIGLFIENPACATAAPLAVSIDASGKINGDTSQNNLRGRYTNGKTLALDHLMSSPKKLFSAPGEILAIKKSVLEKGGGFDRLVDLSQIYKYAITGESGFDPDAKVYWRSHSEQVNKQAKARGVLFYNSNLLGWEESNIIKIWESEFNVEDAQKMKVFRDFHIKNSVLLIVRENITNFRIFLTVRMLLNVLSECPHLLLDAVKIVITEILYYPISIFLILKNRLFR